MKLTRENPRDVINDEASHETDTDLVEYFVDSFFKVALNSFITNLVLVRASVCLSVLDSLPCLSFLKDLCKTSQNCLVLPEDNHIIPALLL